VRVQLDIEERQGELFVVVTAPEAALRCERPVTWAGDPVNQAGRQLLVAKGAASAVTDPAGLAEAVDAGRATAAELEQYGALLFEAAFGLQLWQELIQAALQQHATRQRYHQQRLATAPYLELVIRGLAASDQEPGDQGSRSRAALHSLRWEALHDGTDAVAAQGTRPSPGNAGTVEVGIIRLVPRGNREAPGPEPAGGAGLLIDRIPRVLFAVGSRLTDPDVRPAAELMGILRDPECDGASIHPRVLDAATLTSLRHALATFQPDILHLIGHGRRAVDGEVTVQFRPEPGSGTPADTWVSAEQLLGAFGETGHAPRLVILSACQTASATDPGAGTAAVNAAPFAARLVAGGVPVVIAMAGDIADTACRMFTRALTTAIGHGVPVAKAVLIGRRATFYQRPGFWSTDWVLPTVFLAEDVPRQARLVDPRHSRDISERVHRLGLSATPVFYGRAEFIDAMDRLLDAADPLNVLLAYTPDKYRSFGGERLLRQLGARAVRLGVVPVFLGPFDQGPPTSRAGLAKEIGKSIRTIKASLIPPGDISRGDPARPAPGSAPVIPGVAGAHVKAAAADPDTEPIDLAQAIRADLGELVAALAADPVWARPPGQPRVVLLCHRVHGWVDALDDLLGMLGPTGLHPGAVPVPVVMTGADVDPITSTRTRAWSGKRWATAAPLDRFPKANDEDLLAYLWWLLNPPGGKPVYAPRRSGPQGWPDMLRWIMRNCIYDEDELFGWAMTAVDYFTSEMDHDLLASFSRAAP
jgi:hypothetical protein